jgi:hypothetical protein
MSNELDFILKTKGNHELTAEMCSYAYKTYGFETPFGADRSETVIYNEVN